MGIPPTVPNQRRTQYETNSDDVRRLFEEHGEIKTFFDLIANRGMVFVTYVSVNVPLTLGLCLIHK